MAKAKSARHQVTLTVHGITRVVPMGRDTFRVGRGADADIVIESDVVSKLHLEIIVQQGQAAVIDLGSRNGTKLNGLGLQSGVAYPLQPDSILSVGDPEVTLRVLVAAPAESTQTRQRAEESEAKLARVRESLQLAEAQLADMTSQAEQARESLRLEIEATRAELRHETEQTRARAEAVARREREHADRAEELESLQKLTASLSADADRLAAETARARVEHESTRAAIIDLARQTEETLAHHGKLQSTIEKLTAEIQLLELRKEKEAIDAAMAAQKAEAALTAILERTQTSIAESEAAHRRLEEARAAHAKLESTTTALRSDAIRAEDALEKARASTTELKSKATAEADALLRNARDTEAKARSTANSILEEARKGAVQLTEKARESASQAFERARAESAALTKAGIDKLHAEIATQTKKTEADLAHRRVEAMEAIERMRERELRVSVQRRQDQAEHIVRRARELHASGDLEADSSSLRDFVHLILDGQMPEVPSLVAEKRDRKFRKQAGIGAACAAVAVLLSFALPSAPVAPGGARVAGQRSLASAQLDEARQRQWISELSAFLAGTPGLDERAVAEFIAAEPARLRERERLADTERTELAQLKALLKSPESYEKFRAFEKSFFESSR
jgi:pSer/pThr/pTyr-binding forkhead associated (FHA) protein